MSAKTPVQAGRRTPLSLTGAVTKSQSNKGSNNITNGSGINANGHPASSNSKQETKLQQQKGDQPTVNIPEAKDNPNKKQTLNSSEAKENPNKKPQPTQAEKKIQQNENKKLNEKIQNGAGSSNKQESLENKQPHQNKEKAQHQNRNDETKLNEKEKKEQSDKSEKDITKKREQNVPQNKKDDKKTKDLKDTKEDKKEVASKSDENTEILQQQQIMMDDIKSKDEDKEKRKSIDNKSGEKEEKMDVAEDHIAQKSSNAATPKNSSKANKTATPVNKTPVKIAEKLSQKSTPTKTAKTTHAHKREETTAIDDNDVDMEPLTVENSPVKSPQPEEAVNIKIVPSATSTPGKIGLPKRSSMVAKTDVQGPPTADISTDVPRLFSQISGRRSIRPISGYNPSKCLSNSEFCESYRRINTELDVTNSSMNVTVGSEVPSNFSFSFFGRGGRKRDRTPPPQQSQSAIGELQTDVEISPPKKARLDVHGLLSAVSSPISLLRNRFSKTSLESSTPVKLQQKFNTVEDEIEVQNVSGVSVHEEIPTPNKESAGSNFTTDDNDATLGEEAKETKTKANAALPSSTELRSDGKVSCEKLSGVEESREQADIEIAYTSLQTPVGDTIPKNKRCVVM